MKAWAKVAVDPSPAFCQGLALVGSEEAPLTSAHLVAPAKSSISATSMHTSYTLAGTMRMTRSVRVLPRRPLLAAAIGERQVGIGELQPGLPEGPRQHARIPLQQLQGVGTVGMDRGGEPQVAELELDVYIAEFRRIQADADLGPVVIEGSCDVERYLVGHRMHPGCRRGRTVRRARDAVDHLSALTWRRMAAHGDSYRSAWRGGH